MQGRKWMIVALILALALPAALFAADGTIVGKVTDAKTGQPLPGANVMIVGTTLGAATNTDGSYVIAKVPPGQYTVKVSFIGYKDASKNVKVRSGQRVVVNFQLTEIAISSTAILVLADRAKPLETPVAFSDIKKTDVELRLGSRDIPLALNTTPSVYATPQGGGPGDARINVRGFNQRNVAVMINGVPVNDMENGWVYWSNWDGIADATASIQVQRGLTAVNLATPAIGGMMNIITDPTRQNAGLFFKQEYGSGKFLKTTIAANSGLINGKYAFNALIVRKTGEGIIDKTWTDAWAYYFGAAWNVDARNRLEFYALGAPQRHGQNLYRQNIATYSHELASSLKDYDTEAFEKYNEAGRRFNQNWAPVDPAYDGRQWWNESDHERYAKDFINERENFYHKPQVNLNWYSLINDRLNLYTTVYYSGGHGGGTGTYGSVDRIPWVPGNKWYKSAPWRWNWNSTIAYNDTSSTGAKGILRNSRNNQWTIGAISKANYQATSAVRVTAGIDWRTAEIEHFREVRDLLGGEYYLALKRDGSPQSDFWTMEDAKRRLGDKFDYYFTNTVNWLGVFGQAEYKQGPVTAYTTLGYSTIKYSHHNHFRKDANGNELVVESDVIGGYQVKGGASYKLTEGLQVYGNFGYIAKVPIFDNVINDRTGTKAANPKNERFISAEGGVNLLTLNNTLLLKMSLYNTYWKDRARSIGVVMADGSEGLIFLTGMNQLHRGVEFEGAFQPSQLYRLDFAASVGDWKFTDNVSGVYKDYASGGAEDKEYTFYVKNLKVGDAPQTQLALAGSVYPVRGFQAQLVFRWYDRFYAAWDPFSRTKAEDTAQSWRAPSYYVLDAHVRYELPLKLGNAQIAVFAHVFNLTDELYIQDAVDNSRYNSWDKDHDADDAEVFVGLPRYFNLGISVNY